jgi:hypothetical protein
MADGGLPHLLSFRSGRGHRLRCVRVSIAVAPGLERTTDSGGKANHPGTYQQHANHHERGREPHWVVLIRPKDTANNQKTREDLERRTEDAEGTEPKWHG